MYLMTRDQTFSQPRYFEHPVVGAKSADLGWNAWPTQFRMDGKLYVLVYPFDGVETTYREFQGEEYIYVQGDYEDDCDQ